MNRATPSDTLRPSRGVTVYFALLLALCLLPLSGAPGGAPPLRPDILLLSAAFHLIALHVAASRGGGAGRGLGGVLAVSLAVGAALVYAAWPGVTGGRDPAALWRDLGPDPVLPYLTGAAVALPAALLRRGLARRLRRGAPGHGPRQGLLLAALFAALLGLFALAGVALARAGTAPPAALVWPNAAWAALFTLTVAHFGVGLADRTADDPRNRFLPLALLGLVFAAAQFLAAQAGLTAAAAMARPEAAAVFATGLIAARILLRDFPAALILATALVLGHAPLVAAAGGAGHGPALAFAFLAVCLLVLDLRLSAARAGLAAAATTAPVLPGFQDAAQSWLIRADLAQKAMTFPLAGGPPKTGPETEGATGDALGFHGAVPFADFFRRVHVQGALELLRRLQDPGADASAPLRIALRPPEGESAEPQVFDAFILRRGAGHVWLCLANRDSDEKWRLRAERFEALFSDAILREERLLAIASHELRTPVAILSMLCEELKSGLPWKDVETGFEKTLHRMIAIVDDLRLGNSAEGPHIARNVFTLNELGRHIRETFQSAAGANGIGLKLALPQNSDTALQSDYSRVFVALSKLVHNAIVHSGGTEIVLSCFLTPGPEGGVTVTWQIADDGKGLSEESRRTVFEPFGAAPAEPGSEARPGLGLYAARMTIRLMGGDLALQEEDRGARFILTHPARPASAAAAGQPESPPMTDITPVYPGKTVLLIEDNELVGEITSVRLRKVFGTVLWSKTGPEGLAAFESGAPDMLLVDQLLPGMNGSDLIRKVRATGSRAPIIGITASTIGSECEELEAAGANLALEKPLSFAQIKSIANEFFGDAGA